MGNSNRSCPFLKRKRIIASTLPTKKPLSRLRLIDLLRFSDVLWLFGRMGCFGIISRPCINIAYCSDDISRASSAERGQLNAPLSNLFVEKQKTITFPEKTFDTICSLTTEQKERIFIVRVKLKAESNHRCQTIYAPAQVRIASCKIDLFNLVTSFSMKQHLQDTTDDIRGSMVINFKCQSSGVSKNGCRFNIMKICRGHCFCCWHWKFHKSRFWIASFQACFS